MFDVNERARTFRGTWDFEAVGLGIRSELHVRCLVLIFSRSDLTPIIFFFFFPWMAQNEMRNDHSWVSRFVRVFGLRRCFEVLGSASSA